MAINMNSHSQRTKISTKSIVLLALFTSILFISQIALASIPNIEIVSLLVIIYTLLLGKQVFYIIYGFAILEGLFYGFGIWWFMYLYVWSILALITMLFHKEKSPILFSIISGAFGLFFGFLCSLPYFVTGGIGAGFSYWVSGIIFDITHCIGNVVVTLLLFRPIYNLLHFLLQDK